MAGTLIQPMIYKLYILRLIKPYDPAEEGHNIGKLYENHGITVVGEWINKKNPNELYYITGYRDEEHYNSFIKQMKGNRHYKEINSKLDKIRESVESITLVSREDFLIST